MHNSLAPASSVISETAHVWEARRCTHVELGDVQTRGSGDVQGYSLQLQKERLLPSQPPPNQVLA